MKYFPALIFLFFIGCCSTVYGQNNDLQLAQQYAANGEPAKALDIYQKLYKQDNEAYFSVYIKSLLSLKKFDDAANVTKKMIRKYPANNEYVITLGDVYTQSGNIAKANAIYDEVIKKLPADQTAVTTLAMQFYQGSNIDYAIKHYSRGVLR